MNSSSMEVPEHPSWEVKQPLVLVLLFFIFGIVLEYHSHIAFNPYLLLLLSGSLAWAIISWRSLSPPWPIAPLIIVTGALLTASEWKVLNETSDLDRLALRLPQHVALQGIVQTDPTLRISNEEASLKKQSSKEGSASVVRSEFELKISAVKFHSVWEPAKGIVLVKLVQHSTPKTSDPLKPQEEIESKFSGSPEENQVEFGKKIEVEGVLDHPSTTRNFGLFDYAGYLQRMGIHHLLHVDTFESIRVLGFGSHGNWIYRIRKLLGERLTLGIENDSLATGIIRGMLLGYREDIPNDVNDSFRRTGTFHVFAISGSHISLIALALLIVLHQLRVSRKWVYVFVLPLLIFYVFATGLRASAVRSLVMAAVIILGWSIQRPSALLNNLAASAFIILAWNPFQLFDPGFQLSFMVVASLILLTPVLEKRIRSWVEPDPYIPRSCLPKWRLTLVNPIRWTTGLIAVSLAAWIGSFGLNLYYFNLISMISIVANLLIVPLASTSVALGLISLLLGSIWNQLAITLNTAHALLIHMMVFLSEKLATQKYGYLYLSQPRVEWIISGYACFIAIFLLWIKKEKFKAIGLLSLSLMIIGVATLCAWLKNSVRIDILDVGSGQAILISGPHFERILIDAGNKNQGRMIVKPFLHSQGVNSIDLVILSHGDAAHYGGLIEILDDIPIHRIATADASFRSKGYQQLLSRFEEKGIPKEKWCAGEKKRMNCGELLVLWPTKNLCQKRADDLGLALELKTPYGSCLFAADAGETIEKAIADTIPYPHSMLVQGIHSNEESLTPIYLEKLRPEAIVLNTAEYPLKAYPSPAMQERLNQSKARLYRTDQKGGVIAHLNAEGLSIKSYVSQ